MKLGIMNKKVQEIHTLISINIYNGFVEFLKYSFPAVHFSCGASFPDPIIKNASMNYLLFIPLLVFFALTSLQPIKAQEPKLKVTKMVLTNDGKDLSITLSQSRLDTLTLDSILLSISSKQVGIKLPYYSTQQLPPKTTRKIVGRIHSSQDLAWQPANLKIIYSANQTESNTYYSVRKLRYKKPIEERKSYLSFSSGGLKFFGHKNNIYDRTLTEATIAMHTEMEFGSKIFKYTYLTFNFSEQEITKSHAYSNGNTLMVYGDNWQFSSMMLGVKHELVFGRKLILGQIQLGYCNSHPFYRYPFDSLYDSDKINRPSGTSLIYGIEFGYGYTLNYSTRLIIKSKLIHTNITTNQISQSITGIGLNGGLCFYFNNRKN